MPYSVSLDKENGIVYVQVSGLATKHDHHNARDEALRLCKENNCFRLLVDLRGLNTRKLSITGCFNFGVALAETSPRVRIAHIMPADLKSIRDVKFTSTVEANRGRSTGEFDNIEDARKWLLEYRLIKRGKAAAIHPSSGVSKE